MVYATSPLILRPGGHMPNKLRVFMWIFAIFFATCYLQAKSQNPAEQTGQSTSQAGQEASNASSAELSPEANEKLRYLSTELNLTDDQKEKIKPVLQAESQQRTSLHDDTYLSTEQKEERAKQIHELARAQIRSPSRPNSRKGSPG